MLPKKIAMLPKKIAMLPKNSYVGQIRQNAVDIICERYLNEMKRRLRKFK